MPVSRDTAVRRLAAERRQVLSYALVICRDMHLAEDIYQDVLVLVMKQHDQIESEDKVLAWARGVVRHRAIDAMRRRDRHAKILDGRLLDLVDADWDSIDHGAGVERIEALQHCLSGLSPSAQQMIRSRYHEGLTGDQIAERFGRPRGSIYVTFSRIYRSLAECITRRMAGEVTGE